MTTIHPVPADYPKEIVGYPQPWIVSPGDKVDVKVSCTEAEYSHRTVRVLQGYEGQNGPPAVSQPVKGVPGGTCPGRFQLANPGSYATCPGVGLAEDDEGLSWSFYAQPWLISGDHPQTLASTLDVKAGAGAALVLSPAGVIDIWVGVGNGKVECLSSGFTPEKRKWLNIDLEVLKDTVQLRLASIVQALCPAASAVSFSANLNGRIKADPSAELLLAACYVTKPQDSSKVPKSHFNGRLDSFHFEALGPRPRVLVHYDFSIDIPSDCIKDTSGRGRHGILVNAPSRAVKGHDWDGSETDWTKARYGYGAIHFHEDDLDDAGWQTDFIITVPADARSGVYGVELQSTSSEVRDTVVFFVRPSEASGPKSTSRAALVMSTFTYLAYANEHQFDPDTPARADIPGGLETIEFYKDENFHKQDRRRDLGLSCYDVHRDLSAVMHSSAKRPLLNCRPDYINWTGHRPRELSAELIMEGYMERLGVEYDIVIDHELHAKGVDALRDYTVVITGCRPEYPSLQSYQAYENYVRLGGNLMYLGGNGFYWSTATDPTRPHRLELRRGGQGVRTSYQEPGERHHAIDGHVGGLWRDRGKAANYLVGIGCCGEGGGAGVPYCMTPSLQQTQPDLAAWVFRGLMGSSTSPEGLIFGCNALGAFGGGASADEIDHVDFKYGSPSNIVVLASSTGHPDTFGLFPEDAGFPMTKTLGTQTDLIRSDMTYYDTCGGGAVLSVGSISWYCALGWNGYDNDVAVITKNVLLHFLGVEN
ncbi:hypothetical protein FOPG_16685 [Fusarium oxysporum f. sp. conglutinans race 2 54008]|uniref:N,N-dimethylformamidase beta subunit-like C-terminal domain-containing protein n=1 Tax=Fusarium oxysporum f. sp. conglutinans race 2 54008 TaxID=1089457 RepID=X0GU72_FUSOX|nr:hypothetical protein FOPG_16685 [Fusarium oxysporum f. sp. conglutinans race 2 54008]